MISLRHDVVELDRRKRFQFFSIPNSVRIVVGDCDLTKSLPFVSKKFNSFTGDLWKYTFERLVHKSKDSGHRNWNETLQLFLDYEHSLDTDSYTLEKKPTSKRIRTNSSADMEENKSVGSCLLRKALQIAEPKRQRFYDGYKATTIRLHYWLYCHLLNGYVRYQSPLFFMPDDVRLGNLFGLHFFEPRYRQLIANVMARYPASTKNGSVLTAERCGGTFPTFIYAHNAPLKPGTTACIVQVRQCTIYQNGTADVGLMPISYVRIEAVGTYDQSTNLYGAIASRLSRHDSLGIEFPSRESQSRESRQFVEPFPERTDERNESSIQAMLRFLENRNRPHPGDD